MQTRRQHLQHSAIVCLPTWVASEALLTGKLEVVLPDGRIWNGLRTLRKDNTGYNLKHLFIGSEGTLVLITAATLKLMPLPSANAVGMVAVSSPAKAVELLQHMGDAMGERFSAFELMSSAIVELTRRYFPALPQPFADPHDWYVLMEWSSARPPREGDNQGGLRDKMEAYLGEAMEKGLVLDAVIAHSPAKAERALMVLINGANDDIEHVLLSRRKLPRVAGLPTRLRKV